MDIQFCAQWRKARRGSGSDRLCFSAEEASGLSRLLLAVAVIAVFVGLLDHATGTTADAHASSNHTGELP
jgi:hypothetical protein